MKTQRIIAGLSKFKGVTYLNDINTDILEHALKGCIFNGDKYVYVSGKTIQSNGIIDIWLKKGCMDESYEIIYPLAIWTEEDFKIVRSDNGTK